VVIVLYAAAAFLLLAGLAAASPFARSDLLILAAVSFLLARFVRIERRLDKYRRHRVHVEDQMRGLLVAVESRRRSKRRLLRPYRRSALV
jgi:hypothetical protein